MNFSLQQSKSHLKAVLIFFTRFFFKKLQQIGNLRIAGALIDARIFFLKNVNTPGRGAPLLISLLERHYDENIFCLETKDMNGCVWRVLIQGVISLQHSVQWNLRLDEFINSGANSLGWSIKCLSALEQMTLASSCHPSTGLGLLVYHSSQHSLLPYTWPTSHVHNACLAPGGTWDCGIH